MTSGKLPPNMMCIGHFWGNLGKPLFLHSNNRTKMAKKKKKKHLTRVERIAKEYPDGFYVRTYSSRAEFIGFMLGLILVFLFAASKLWIIAPVWIRWGVYVFTTILGWVLGRKFSEAIVNLKITNVGLEQMRVSGSILVPKERTIEWENMRLCFMLGEFRRSDFCIKTRKGSNYRLMTTYLFRRFSDYDNAFVDFKDEFERRVKEKHIPIK